jgi:hypothetical protein
LCGGAPTGSVPEVSHSIPLQLPADDKLDLLRYLDEFHYWHSLDDERICKRCERTITGRQILVIELQGTRGKLRLQCPSAGCGSTPGDWAYANPVQAAKLRRNSETTAAPVERTHRGNAGRAARERKETKTTRAAKNGRPKRSGITPLTVLRGLATALHAIRPIA